MVGTHPLEETRIFEIMVGLPSEEVQKVVDEEGCIGSVIDTIAYALSPGRRERVEVARLILKYDAKHEWLKRVSEYGKLVYGL
jgi:ABC-type transport system involved in cytochrome bd biosynthesis fused ATPase/permease subunit